MTRAERRRLEKEAQKSKKTYTFTQEQLELAVREAVLKEEQKIREDATNKAVNTAMVLTLTYPLYVLMTKYWKKSYAKRLPEFTEEVLKLHEAHENGKISLEKMREDLWELGGVRLEEAE